MCISGCNIPYGKSAAGIAFYAYIIPFFISTAMGAVISGIIVFSIKRQAC